MSILMTFRIAAKALARNKLRTSLTMLGMIIGVGAVITMVSLGQGARASIDQQIQSAGTNMIIVMAGNWTQGGVRSGAGGASTLTLDDAAAIRRQVPEVDRVAPTTRTSAQLVYENQNWFTRVQGTNPDFPIIRVWPLQYGQFFTDSDVDAANKAVVLGTTVAKNLFGDGVDPTGEIIRVKNLPFKVVGVLASKGQSGMGDDQDDTVFVPITTAQKKLMGITYINGMTISGADQSRLPQAEDHITEVLRARHKILPGDADDFMVRTLEEMAAVRLETTNIMSYLLLSIASVSLLVGGIGIMNIMLVSVTERTREIGIRLAIGARGRDVLLQFLVEAMAISLVGGVIGILLGFIASRTLTNVFEWPTLVSPQAVSVAFVFAAATGIFFGFYPARKAAGLDPIDALRYE